MNSILAEGLISFLGFIAFVTLHEFAHAWTADRLGDDTPRRQGRLTIDPFAHIELIGTIILPLVLIFFSAAQGNVFFFGWGKPVMVNVNNFSVRRRDDILVSFAGPFMNLLLGIGMLIIMRLGVLAGATFLEDQTFFRLVDLTFLLFFFNLLPVPPLDGGHIMRNFLNISDHAYAEISQYSFMFFIIIMRVPGITHAVVFLSQSTTNLVSSLLGWHFTLS